MEIQNSNLKWEKELLGLYISGHPLQEHKDKLNKHEQTLDRVKKLPEGMEIVTAGLLEEAKVIMTKRTGEKMMFGKLEDLKDTIEIVAFPSTYKEHIALFEPGTCLAIRGKVSHRNGSPSIIVDKVKRLE